MKNKYAEVWNKSHEFWANTQTVEYDNWMSGYDEVINNAVNIIDLGCGGSSASNTRYLLSLNKNVVSCDFSKTALDIVGAIPNSKIKLFDMLETFPFEDDFADIVVADLSLHYFKEEETFRVLSEIKRVLKKDGYLFFRLNSVNSIEFNNIIKSGKQEVEPRLYLTNNLQKRFFNKDDILKFFFDWEIIEISEENMTRWSEDKIVWKCVVKNTK